MSADERPIVTDRTIETPFERTLRRRWEVEQRRLQAARKARLGAENQRNRHLDRIRPLSAPARARKRV